MLPTRYNAQIFLDCLDRKKSYWYWMIYVPEQAEYSDFGLNLVEAPKRKF